MDIVEAIFLHSEGKMSDKRLLSNFLCTKEELPKKITGFFNKAIQEKNARNIEAYIYLVSAFNLYCQELTDIFSGLILEDWHERHEDIAGILQRMKDPKSVDALFQAIYKQYDYLNYDDSYSFEVKCIWALGDIGDNAAKEKLSCLSESGNEIISENAKKQLQRIDKCYFAPNELKAH